MATKHFKLGHHLVAFLDVLGQRDKFRGLSMPTNADESARVKEILRQTAGFVVDLRGVFHTQFQTFEKGVEMGTHTKEPLRPNFVGFSDSFVTTVPLRNDGSDLVPVVTVYSVLAAAAIVMLTSLTSKHPLRGGIDVGLATEIGPGEIYGTALESAYFLESEVAQYPRIVIGDEFWKYLNSVRAKFGEGKTQVDKAITAITQKIVGLIATDTDGKRILDYLGPVIVEISAPGCKEHIVQPAYEFVLAEQKRLITEGNTELLKRYASFRSYCESRLSLWSIPVSNRRYM